MSTDQPASKQRANDLGARSQWQLIRIRFQKHRLAVISMYVLIVMYLISIGADFIAPYPPRHDDLSHPYCPPQLVRFSATHGPHTYALKLEIDPITFRRTYIEDTGHIVPLDLLAESEAYKLFGLIPMRHKFFGVDRGDPTNMADPDHATLYLLGTDRYGRDVFSRIIHGSRISLSVGLVGIVCTFILGMSVGGVSGYVGGRTDTLIQRFIEIINAFPQLPLWLALAAVMPDDWSALKSYFAITVVLSMLNWTGLARVVRGKILSLREEDYAVAAKLLGASHSRILFRHLIPGFTSHIIVALTLSVPGMILGETSLSFLGLGLRSPIISWGVMLQDCLDVQAIRFYPWLLLPVAFIVATVLSFNFLGDGLRDAADPYSVN